MASAAFALSPALRRALVLLLVSSALLLPAESQWVGKSATPRKRVSLTRHAHAQRRQQQLRAATTVVHGGPGGAKIVSAVGFPLVRSSSAPDGASDGASTAAVTPAGSAPIKYHGGPVVVGAPAVNVYHIYYGSWGAGSGRDVIDAFVQSLSSDSGSQGGAADASVKAWWAISAAYYQNDAGGKKNVSSKVRLAGTAVDNYSRGKQLSDADVLTIVKSKVGAGKPLALDAQGIYVVLPSADVTLPGFCSEYCGWHTQDSLNSTPLRFAFVGHHGQCPGACGVKSTSPNGKPAVDAIISTLAHELTEAATDPDTNAGWFDDDGEENADKCAWDFGSTKTGSQQNGQSYEYNVVGLNGMKFLVQLNWDHVKSKCVLQNVLPADSSGGGGTPSPPPPPPPAGGPPPPIGGSVKMRVTCLEEGITYGVGVGLG
ncbi:unnamed protein product [Closterium sp. Naga37s-1]|nr:unnamed protein product [Closterium sp. Naga37s-1]